MKKMNMKQIVGLFVLAALVFGLLGMAYGRLVSFSQADIDTAVGEAVKDMYDQSEVDESIAQATEGLLNPEEVQVQIDEKDSKIAELESELSTAAEIIEEPEVEVVYNLDEIEINDTVTKTLSDKHIELFDGEVTFDDDEYDAEESLKLIGLIQKANGNDFKENTYLQIPAYSIEYIFSVENSFNTSEIEKDETLEISLLGKDVEISKWIDGEITLTGGAEYIFEEGQSIDVEGKTITAKIINDNYVYVDVDGVAKKITEEDSSTVNGIEIYVDEVLDNEAGEATPDMATLRIGNDIKSTIETGDEYDEDNDFNVWEWNITAKEIKLTNAEAFMYLDEDDTEFNVLGVGENLCLPNDYVCVEYNGLDEEATETYRFDLYTKSGTEYIRVKGNFVVGLNDFDKIYINQTHIFDKDLNEITEAIELGDTEMELVPESGFIKFENVNWVKEFRVNYNLSDVDVNYGANNLVSTEDSFRTLYGIIVENPEDSCEDQEFSIVVPEEQLMGSITVY